MAVYLKVKLGTVNASALMDSTVTIVKTELFAQLASTVRSVKMEESQQETQSMQTVTVNAQASSQDKTVKSRLVIQELEVPIVLMEVSQLTHLLSDIVFAHALADILDPPVGS